MAYLSFSPLVTENEARAATPADAEQFSALELRVIALAAEPESRGEIGVDGLFGRVLERFFGFRLPRPLADPRLEALRRFAVRAHHAPDDVGEEDIRALVAAGFSLGQARGLRAYLAPRGARGAVFA
jgi:hypothetical protein